MPRELLYWKCCSKPDVICFYVQLKPQNSLEDRRLVIILYQQGYSSAQIAVLMQNYHQTTIFNTGLWLHLHNKNIFITSGLWQHF